jgi:hypothetical protein
MHFIVVQIVALLASVIAKSRPFSETLRPDELLSFMGYHRDIVVHIFWFFGFLTFCYALCLGLAATAGIFRVAIWYDKFMNKRLKPTQPPAAAGRGRRRTTRFRLKKRLPSTPRNRQDPGV